MQSINNNYSCGYYNKYIHGICVLISTMFKYNKKVLFQ